MYAFLEKTRDRNEGMVAVVRPTRSTMSLLEIDLTRDLKNVSEGHLTDGSSRGTPCRVKKEYDSRCTGVS